MPLSCRFAIISDLHIALPHTIWNHPSRFHLVEMSIPGLEVILQHLSQLDLDFLLLPGDLTQHGEPENHQWLADRLAQLPYPVYVVPGNHDVPVLTANGYSIGLHDFTTYYRKFGYEQADRLYYTCELVPGVRLIGLNSNQFDEEGHQLGAMDAEQLLWLQQVLATYQQEVTLVMIHHNVLEHLPGQSKNPLGRRYLLDNADELLTILRQAEVQLVFTGHLHIQDIAYQDGIYDITTGSLVTYPHVYRLLHLYQDEHGQYRLQIESHRVQSVPEREDLQQWSREWMGDRSFSFVLKLLTHPPLNLPLEQAQSLAPDLRYFWASIASGDANFQFPQFPPSVRRYFEAFSAIDADGNFAPIDNTATLILNQRTHSSC
ncbi:MAG: metallophosphoesterase [Cyanobacteria bacterium]|nr:metallophosphoesterase [Cyanobacteriota bacterium]MDW8201864.1 metallophosphoesterase [Cyanobacteriota bacterium SKYGB_h_bin112]